MQRYRPLKFDRYHLCQVAFASVTANGGTQVADHGGSAIRDYGNAYECFKVWTGLPTPPMCHSEPTHWGHRRLKFAKI